MLFIKKTTDAATKWYDVTEIPIHAESLSLIVVSFGIISVDKDFIVMDTRVEITSPKKVKAKIDELISRRLELGYTDRIKE
jgi:hypothetical protein